MLSSVMSSSAPVNQNLSCYQVANVSQPTETPTTTTNSIPAAAPLLPANINDLFQKLVATGIITSEAKNQQEANAKTAAATNKKEKSSTTLKPVYFDKMDTLKL